MKPPGIVVTPASSSRFIILSSFNAPDFSQVSYSCSLAHFCGFLCTVWQGFGAGLFRGGPAPRIFFPEPAPAPEDIAYLHIFCLLKHV